MSASLVGSEMCIRDRSCRVSRLAPPAPGYRILIVDGLRLFADSEPLRSCLLYTSDAADDM
eukprot:8145594-Alexandrium_andersonii.AAC.1